MPNKGTNSEEVTVTSHVQLGNTVYSSTRHRHLCYQLRHTSAILLENEFECEQNIDHNYQEAIKNFSQRLLTSQTEMGWTNA